MAIADSQKVDYLWKKLGYGAAKTDTNARKKAPNEAIVSPLLLRGDRIWNKAGDIPTVMPSADTDIVEVYLGGNSVETTEDGTSTNNRTWKTGLTDWIPPEFGSTYQAKIYIDSPSASDPTSTGTQIFATGSGNDDEWFFDYQAGVLHFISDNLPSSLNDSKTIYVSGARYVGVFGQPATFENLSANTFTANVVTSKEVVANIVNTTTFVSQTVYTTTITTNNITANVVTANTLILDNPLATQYGGTGLDQYIENGVFFASATNTIGFVTGTSGKILQINSDGEPVFDDIDGGSVT